MSTGRRDAIDAALDAALDLPGPERLPWLEREFAGDPELIGEVRALLAAHSRAGGILEAAPVPRPGRLPDAAPQRRIGPYRVVRELGRGGMGVVYLADRDDGQFRRRVAVKLLRASPDADELQRRFLAERQILASLDHPNIAQLLDGGVTDGELPYLVMEYVDGLPITTYCDRHRLTLDERVRLFVDVCAAVRHAHQNLVVHRDIKPGNIFVTADGRVKLLDFGIAKLLNPGLAGVAQPVTRTEFRVMTPEYASPEQIRGEPLSTASDVYALGVVLYELLTGRRPYHIASGSPAELATVVCEREPERPSSRALRGTGEAGTDPAGDDPDAAAAARSTTPERLRRALRGDLDAIVMMALRKEPRQRYGTAEQLARDLERFLDGREVLAHRGGRAYRLRRFVARHRASAAAAAVVLLSLLGGAGVALWQAAAARAERDRAAAALERSERVTAFLTALLESNDPMEGHSPAQSVGELLSRAASQVDQLSDQPEVQARILEVVGRVYLNLADYSAAHPLLERALAIREQAQDSTEPAVGAVLLRIAESLRRQYRFDEAVAAASRGLRLRRVAGGTEQPDPAEFLLELSGLAIYQNDHARAESLAAEAVEWRRAMLGPPDTLLGNALERYAATVRRRGESQGAVAAMREALSIYAARDPDGPWASYLRLRLADVLSQDLAEYPEADALYRRSVAALRSRLGPDHPRAMFAANDYGRFLLARGDAARAAALFQDNLERMPRVFGSEHPATAGQLGLVGAALAQRGHYAEAESLVRRELAIYERVEGRTSNEYTGALASLGRTLAGGGRLREADSVHRVALAIRRDEIGETETNLYAIALAGIAGVAVQRGALAEADSLYREALRILRLSMSDEHRDVRRMHAGLARVFAARGMPDSAEFHRRLGRGVVPY